MINIILGKPNQQQDCLFTQQIEFYILFNNQQEIQTRFFSILIQLSYRKIVQLIQFQTFQISQIQQMAETTLVDPNLNEFLSSIQLPFAIKSFSYRTVKKYSRDGHWNEKERLKYTVFVKYFRSTIEDEQKKWGIRIYDMMADMIYTRNSSQCRSHHQKMLKFNITIPSIISGVTAKYQPRIYEQIQKKYLVLIKGLLESLHKYKRPSVNSEENMKTNSSIYISTKTQRSVNSSVSKPIFQQLKQQRKLVETEIVIQKNDKEDKQGKGKTAAQYEVYEEQQEDEEPPQLQPYGLIVPDCLPINPQITSKLGNEIGTSNIFPSYIQYPLCLGQDEKMYYSKQIQAIEAQKQWHCQNAQNLCSQWKTQLEAITRCDKTISLYRLAVTENQYT